MVPAMIYIVGMPVKLIPGTSLFVTIFISAIVTILHAFNYGSIDLTLVVPLILGSILGVQLGQKLGQYLDSSHLKTLFALLLCAVAIAIAYDSFFRDKTNEAINVVTLASKIDTKALEKPSLIALCGFFDFNSFQSAPTSIPLIIFMSLSEGSSVKYSWSVIDIASNCNSLERLTISSTEEVPSELTEWMCKSILIKTRVLGSLIL